MAISYQFERDTVFTNMGKSPSPDQIGSYLATVVADPAYRPGMPSLVDCRDVTTVLSPGDLRAIVERIRELTRSPAAGRCAVLAGSDVVFGLLRMYEVYSEGEPVEVRAFRERDRAIAWLKEDEGSLSDAATGTPAKGNSH